MLFLASRPCHFVDLQMISAKIKESSGFRGRYILPVGKVLSPVEGPTSDATSVNRRTRTRYARMHIIILFLGVYGTIAAPYEPLTDREFRTLGNDADDDTEVVEARLPGSTNLNEKALPISRLYVIETDSLPGNQNLKERTQIRAILPGTQNLAEKSIPDYVLKRMANPENRRISSHPDFEEIPIQ
uniref:uncharacterized protein LOC127067481 isoform X1 n=1 Tax=Vespula vulgaris TaxID=7454 RepID=UPI00223BB4A7|nr:uncharacterized protein LOC127067481 isoform X1 [Vespula vulgaris]